MKRNVLWLMLCIQSAYYVTHAAESTANVPSLASLAWQTFKKNAERYRSIPPELEIFIKDELCARESLEDDPYTFLKLVDQLQLEAQRNRALKYFALQLYNCTPGKPEGDVQKFTRLTYTVSTLPDYLCRQIWKFRNDIHDVTAQFSEEAP